MRYRTLAAVLALTLLSACGTAGNGSGSAAISARPPEEPLVLDTLALELPSGTDPALARTFAEALPGEMAKYGVELASVELSFGTSPAATAQALAEGGVDLAFAFALEASLRALLSPEQCLTLLGAEAFAPVEDTALAPTRRALLSAGTA